MKQILPVSCLLFALFTGFLLNAVKCDAQEQFYPISGATNLASLSDWTTDPDGQGSPYGLVPASFTAPGQVFNIVNKPGTGNANLTITSSWTVSGTAGTGDSSYIVIGDGVNPVTFTIPAADQLTLDSYAYLDSLTANATFVIMNTASLSSIKWFAKANNPNPNSTSTIDFLDLGSCTTIPVSFVYGNVIFDGTKYANTGGTASNTGALQFQVAGNFIMQNTSGSGAGFIPVGPYTNIILVGSANQTLTGNGYEFHCYDFSDTTKTNGDVTFAVNTPINIFEHICLKQENATNEFSDGGNTDTVGNNVNMSGVASAYNLTGTIMLNGTSGTQKITNNYSLADASAIIAPLNNLTINCSDKVTFYTNTSRQNITLKGNLLITTSGGNAITLVNTNPTTGSDTFKIGGNYINNSTTAVTFNAKTIYELNGNAAQTLKTDITGGETFPNLTIDNTSATGVTLNSPFSVSGAFTLTDGLVNTTLADTLTLFNAATSTAGSTASYVNGPMVKEGNTLFVFPIGGGGWFAPLGISAPQTSTNYITVYFTLATPVNPYSLDAPLTNVSALEYWTMSESHLADAISNVTLYWQNGPLSGIDNYNNTLQVADCVGSAWNDLGESAVTGTYPGAGTVTSSSGITGFSNLPVTFGSTNYTSNPLPVTLTFFGAAYIEESKSVLINWTVATQLNNKEFVVEKTQDGINYTEVATLQGAGTTSISQSYSAVDDSPIPGTSYYRLKQIDVDGNATDFPPATVVIGNDESSSVNLFPNPVVANAMLTYISEDNQPVVITIMDLDGKVESSLTYSEIRVGQNNLNINTTNLSRGMYLLRVSTLSQTYYSKFIKL